MTIGALFILILPVFALIAVGVALRRFHWIEGEAETSMIRFAMYVCMPCLAFDAIVGNPRCASRATSSFPRSPDLRRPPRASRSSYGVARVIGLHKGTGLRTFAISAGVCNYSYLPLPIVGGIWGERAQGVVLVHNMGVDMAIWSVGLLVLTGAPAEERLAQARLADARHPRGGDRDQRARPRALRPGARAGPRAFARRVRRPARHRDDRRQHRRVPQRSAQAPAPQRRGGLVRGRLGIMPVLMLCFAKWLPCPVELKRVLVVEAAMPAAVLPILLAQYYGGQPLTAVQVVLSTTAVGLFTSPFWIRAGLAWLGIG